MDKPFTSLFLHVIQDFAKMKLSMLWIAWIELGSYKHLSFFYLKESFTFTVNTFSPSDRGHDQHGQSYSTTSYLINVFDLMQMIVVKLAAVFTDLHNGT